MASETCIPTTVTPWAIASLPDAFRIFYTPQIDEWGKSLCSESDWYTLMEVKCAITNEFLNTDRVTFVDDVTKLHPHCYEPEADNIEHQLNIATYHLHYYIGARGHALNEGKSAHLVTLRGVGAHKATLDLPQNTSLKGDVCNLVRGLCPFLHHDLPWSPDVTLRIKAAKKGWRMVGRIWFESVSHRVNRLLFISFV